MRCVLAIDSGGSKCDALLVRADGAAIGGGRCSIADPESGRGVYGSGRSRQTIMRAVALALGQCDCQEVHVSSLPDWMRAEPCLRRFKTVVSHPVDEYEGPMALAGAKTGVVALAGTGAFVLGITREGKTCRLDGLGPNLGDYGSGYHIGIMALRATARSEWHPRHHTSIAEPVIRACARHYGDERFPGLIDYSLSNPDRAEIASLARIVNDEAIKGDRVARKILWDAATCLAETLYDVLESLGMRDDEYPLVGTGGVIASSGIYWRRFCALAREFAPGLKPFRSPMPPVVGVALAVLEQMGVAPMAKARRTLFRSIGELASAGALWRPGELAG